MFKPRTWVFLTLALTIFATVTLFAGVFSPLWIFLDCGVIKVCVGLLYRTEEKCTLEPDDSCANAPTSFDGVQYNTPSTSDKVHWSVVAGLEVGGAVMGLLLVILFVAYACYFSSKRSLTWFNAILMLASILTWIPVGFGLIVFAIYHGDAFTHGQDVSAQSFPWSALICFIAAIHLVFVTILIRSCCRKESYTGPPIPASVDSKINLLPSSQSALANKYFPPSAFREDHLQGLNAVMSENGQTENEVDEKTLIPSFYDDREDPQKQVVRRTGSVNYNNQAYRPESTIDFNNVTETDKRRHTIYKGKHGNETLYEENNLQVSNAVIPGKFVGEQPLPDAGGYNNQAYRPESIIDYNNTTETDHRRLTTEVVLDRQGSGKNVDLDNERKELFIYKGKDDMRKLDDIGPRNDETLYQEDNLHVSNAVMDQEAQTGGYKNQAYKPESSILYNMTNKHMDLANEGKQPFIYKRKGNMTKTDSIVPGGSGHDDKLYDQHDILYSAQQITDKGDHTGNKYMVHTEKPNEASPTNKRLVLSPNNFSEGNVKYNPTYAYRPYSEQIY